ncbi:MAG: adenylate/guanylate cyclase domain-containing protein [Proteobacteria bacterium]|nr:adenylate/guanylate cyclase domain-containing protein [Pseudomonadota bacterium]
MDIVEYSKKSVTGQISLKDRFNAYLSKAIEGVDVADRIILDTGDGAAVTFLGDIEAALKAAISLRESLLAETEDPDIDPQLLVRIGINSGPVRVVRDINGHPNVVGDGINVAQRVMAFAEPSQILVSRAYYDQVSPISDLYTGMFHYQGSRTDKHVREHEIFAIGYPGDQTNKVKQVVTEQAAGPLPDGAKWIKQLDGKQRVIIVALAMAVLLAAVFSLTPKKTVVTPQLVETMQPAVVMPISGVPGTKPADKLPKAAVVDKNSAGKSAVKNKADQPVVKKPLASGKPADVLVPGKKGNAIKPAPETDAKQPDGLKESYLMVSCKEDAQLFVDSVNKGKIASGSLTVVTRPGQHKLILMHASFGIFTQEVTLEPGKTEHIKPKVCN